MPDSKYHILAVDDEIHNLEAIERTLRGAYHVHSASDCSQAIDIFKNNDVHLIITDQVMPDMSGTDLLAELQTINPNPVRIVLSAYSEIEYLIAAINEGRVYNYISKPWEPEALILVVAKALEFYQANMDRLALSEALVLSYSELATKNTSLEQAMGELAQAREKLMTMERLSVIAKMARMITHDLRQPLDIIRSAADTMARIDLDPDDRLEISEMIRYEVDTFMEMINELLEYTRGSFDIQAEKMTLNEFFAVSQNRLKAVVQDSPINIIFEQDETEAFVHIDRKLIQRALINIVKNSVEALTGDSENLSPRIIISSAILPETAEIWVADNGPGIPADAASSVFQPFVSTHKKQGFGLGLAIVAEIARQHGGNIELAPTVIGATFKITLPLYSKQDSLINA